MGSVIDSEAFRRLLFSLLSCYLLALKFFAAFFDGHHFLRGSSPELLGVELLNELGQRGFPPFLMLVRQLPEVSWIQAQLPGHLNLGMAQMILLSSVNPNLEFVRYVLFLHG